MSRHAVKLVGKRIADAAVAADLECADLIDVAGNGCLGDFEAQGREARGDLFLIGEHMLADQVGHRLLSSVLELAHLVLMHFLACLCNIVNRASMIRTAILGASGYVGGELLRLISAHPELRAAKLFGESKAGKDIAEVHPHLAAVHAGTAFERFEASAS